MFHILGGCKNFKTQADNYDQAATKKGKTVKYIFENEPSKAVKSYLNKLGIIY